MSKQTQALKLALEALESVKHKIDSYQVNVCDDVDEAITAIREALAERCVCGEPDTPGTHRTDGPCLAEQPVQEPVAWMWRCKPYCNWPEWSVSLKRPADSGRDGHKRTEGYEDVPLYTSPPASKPWVGLTDEERMDVLLALNWDKQLTHMDTAKSIEAKLREKNHG